MENIITKIKQFFCNHDWPMTRGWYGEPHHNTPPCRKCGKVYDEKK